MAETSQLDHDIERAFQRFSRPQLPTIPTSSILYRPKRTVHSTPSWIPPLPPVSGEEAAHKGVQRSVEAADWIDFIPLGTLTQGGKEFLVCRRRNEKGALVMVKKVKFTKDSLAQRLLSLRHQHIMMARYFLDDNESQHIGFQYVRFTLAEMLSTHMPVEEIHLRAIALPIFSAIQYLKDMRLTHGHVSTTSIRICGRTGKVFLGDCDGCVLTENGPQSTDLEGLGLTLLNCMESNPPQSRTAEQVRTQRATNKVFGLRNAEKWSGYKSLMDFLDDLFSLQRRPAVKLERPHEYLLSEEPSETVLLPYLELASFECFTLWEKAQT